MTSAGTDTHRITGINQNRKSEDVIWDDIMFTSAPSYYWMQYSETEVWLIWGVASSHGWDYNNTALQNGVPIRAVVNGTDNVYATAYGGSIGGLCIGQFDPSWYAAHIEIVAISGSITRAPKDSQCLISPFL